MFRVGVLKRDNPVQLVFRAASTRRLRQDLPCKQVTSGYPLLRSTSIRRGLLCTRPLLAVFAHLAFMLPLAFSSVQADEGGVVIPQFQYEAALSDGGASLRQAELPWSVLSAMRQVGLTDLRVYNADNQLVPFRVPLRGAVRLEQEKQRELSFFSGENTQHFAQLLRSQQNLTVEHIRRLEAANRQYLIIPISETDDGLVKQRSVAAPAEGLTALELEWQNLQQWFPKSLRVESSDDLLSWQPVGIERLPYVLSERGVLVENQRIELKQPLKTKFIRLSGGQDFKALLPALSKVRGHYQSSTYQPPALNWQPVELTVGDKPQQYRYDPSPALPLTRWRLDLPQLGHLYEGKLYSRRPQNSARSGKKQSQPDWRYVRDFQQYHLQTTAGVVRSGAESVDGLAGQQWLLQFNQPLASDLIPRIEVAWQPADVYFIAQGRAPFRLVYGSANAKAIPAMQLDSKLIAGAEKVQVGEAIKLSMPDIGKPVNWLAWLLWAVLGGSVVFLLWMARRLWREFQG